MKTGTMCLKIVLLYYPMAFKGCLGIVLTHGFQLGSLAGVEKKPGCISEIMRYRKFILAGNIGYGV